MPDRIAERLLRFFASREVASTIAGDLRELAVTRGKVWFWFAIARTMSGLLWKDLTSAPLFLAALGLRGLLVAVSMGILILAVGFPLIFGPGARRVDPAKVTAAWFVTTSVIQFITGLYLAKRSRGRELAAVLAYIALNCLVRAVPLTFFAIARSSKIVVFSWGNVVGLVANLAPLFLAAILARFRQRESLSSVVRL